MNKIIITRWNDRLLTAQFSGQTAVEVGLEEPDSILGNIYIGKVKTIVKNLNSAFVDFGENRTGYYSLTDNPAPLFADGTETVSDRNDGTASPRRMKPGDNIIVQVAKDAVKTKDPVLTANLNFTGKYAVLTAGKQVIGFSAKISDRSWKDSVKPQLEALTDGDAGLIVRTNAYGHEKELLREVGLLLEQYRAVLKLAPYRTHYSMLYEAEPEYIKSLRSCPEGSIEEIITDDESVYGNVRQYLALYQPDSMERFRLYQDSMVSLANLYSLPSVMEQACQKRVWLKSGGYLIIEPTEAMVVIDVNTGKYSGRKNLADTIRLTNLEAAKEICHQLRLRNLSGIIMIDFIDMESEDDKALLMDTLRSLALSDPVKVHVIDMTPLGLVELTRKKGKKPLWEQVNYKKGI